MGKNTVSFDSLIFLIRDYGGCFGYREIVFLDLKSLVREGVPVQIRPPAP